MGTQAVQLEPEASHQVPEGRQWRFATRVAFRFCFVYFGLYCLATQVSTGLAPLSNVDIPDPATLWPVRQVVLWTAAHIFRVTTPLVYTGSGSGDKTFDWVLAFCLLLVSVVATTVWSTLDGKRENYSTLYKWFRIVFRFCLAGQMLSYGLVKAVPLQMPFPRLARLLQHFGDMSPMGVLWSSIGAFPGYEVFAGCAEILGGILLIFPRTTTLGALVCLADAVDIFALNMTYDVPVKLFSFHLILMSLFLLAPDFERLTNLFVLNRTAGPSTQIPLFATPRGNRIALAGQVGFGLWLVGMNAYSSWTSWYRNGGGSPKSPLYGIWDVNELTIDGQTRLPLITDSDRWRRAVFDSPDRMAFQHMDESFARYNSSINDKTLALTKADDKNWKASFIYQRPVPEQLILDGGMDGHIVHMQLQLVDRKKFLLVSRGFHWIQEYPFNR